MRFDPFDFLSALERKHPRLGRFCAMQFLGILSPFNRHLRAQLLEWSDEQCVVGVKRRRRVRNHVGGIHAGALFTLGETCAGLVIIRNFPFKNFRPLMSDVHVTYLKQARGDVIGTCVISRETLAGMRAQMEAGEIPTVELITNIANQAGEIIVVATTTWQVKPWELVKTK